MWQLVVFVGASAGLTLYSLPYLHNWRAHGFFRYFAWEAILALVLLNVQHWLTNPFSLLQIISWTCLLVSLLLIVEGVRLMRTVGKPEGRLENTTQLVSVGLYKYIRHPLYSSLLFLAWGAFLKQISITSVVLVLAATVFLYGTARVEEAEDLDKFGLSYSAYMSTTKMFIPFLV